MLVLGNLNWIVPSAQKLHRAVRITFLIALGFVTVCGTITRAHAQAITGFGDWSWGTVADRNGVDIGTGQICFLSGVTGQLNVGGQGATSSYGLLGWPSEASVLQASSGHYVLLAHGGGTEDQQNQPASLGNPVNAQATCTFDGSNPVFGSISWLTQPPLPLKLEGLPLPSPVAKAILPRRQCFLTGVQGVAGRIDLNQMTTGSWTNPNHFVKVWYVSKVDVNHPTTGWYLESNLPNPDDGTSITASAVCVDFPSNATVTTKPVQVEGSTFVLTQGSGIKLCGLTELGGQFTTPSWTDGVTMIVPPTLDGNWQLTLSPNKTAAWACVQ